MPHSEFDTSWLNHRFAFDEAARNPAVEAACLNYLSTTPTLNLVDVGSGTGANFIHFFEKLDRPQQWHFVDWDQRLLQASLQRISAYAQEKSYPVQSSENRLSLDLGTHTIQIQTHCGSFEQIEDLVDLTSLDIVMASAFFDLFRPDQLLPFLEKLRTASTAFLFTLNYVAMHFDPALPDDQQMVQYYEDHMQRPKAAGAGMGPHCSAHIREWLSAGSVDFVEGESTWQIGPGDTQMFSFLLGFMHEAIGELSLSTAPWSDFENWWRHRKQASESGELDLAVKHFDFFAKF